MCADTCEARGEHQVSTVAPPIMATMTVALLIVVLLETGGLIALGVVLIVSRRSLESTRRARDVGSRARISF